MNILGVLFCIFVCSPCVCSSRNPTLKFNYNNTYKYQVEYEIEISRYVEYVMEFAGDNKVYNTPARVRVASELANKTYPLFVTARQQKGVFSWQLPMVVQTPKGSEMFTSVARTLCPHFFEDGEVTCDASLFNVPIVHLTTSSPKNITVNIIVETVTDFYVELNKDMDVTVSPSQPRYYFYPFKQEASASIDVRAQMLRNKELCRKKTDAVGLFKMNHLLNDTSRSKRELSVSDKGATVEPGVNFKSNYVELTTPSSVTAKNVIIQIESDNDVCAVVSIQNFSCPVFDNERDILYDGYYLTMTRHGGITLSQDLFNLGFYIVFIVKSSDEDCLGEATISNNLTSSLGEYFQWKNSYKIEAVINDARVKSFRFKITETISYADYITGSVLVLGFFLSFYIAVLLVVLLNGTRKWMSNGQSTSGNSNGGAEDSPLNGSEVGSSTPPVPTSLLVQISVDGNSGRQVAETSAVARKPSSSSDTDSDSDNSPVNKTIDIRSKSPTNHKLCVAHLAQKRSRVISYRSKMYLWNVLIVTVFYTLPVIQLVVTYQRMLNQSGNQDLCYYNFLCAHPLFMLSDFNHVYSNIGYVLLGTLFLIEVWRRHQQYKQKTLAQKELGIPQHFGLLYAMAIALVSEGLLSGAYHVCPNSMNFQFDTSFMYVTSVLCMIKIYQNRHPDINARAHATFGVLALIIFLGLVGVLNANIYFWAAFTILHLGTCLVMTFQIYYMGRFRLERNLLGRAARELMRHPITAITPMYCGRMVLLFIANLANWAIAAYGLAQHKTDFASHLLIILMSNLFLYTLFYIIMKLLNKERIVWYSWVFIALTYSFWFISGYFYLDKGTDWSQTPALSRNDNKFCSFLELYDSHDIWHFLSAIAMFFSFNMYLTLDDNLSYKPRSEIMVF